VTRFASFSAQAEKGNGLLETLTAAGKPIQRGDRLSVGLNIMGAVFQVRKSDRNTQGFAYLRD
jgi:hypothetical protein